MRCLPLLLLAGCAGGRIDVEGVPPTGNGDGGGGGAVQVTPASVTLTVQGAAATQQFTARAMGGDVTSRATWTVGDPAMGSISPAGLFTTAHPLPRGGAVAISANWQGSVGVASAIIRYLAPDVVDPSAPGGAPGMFGGPATNDDAPRVVYPLDGVMLARNILQMNLQWQGHARSTVYRLHVKAATIERSFFVGAAACAGGTRCSYRPPDADWQMIAQSAAGERVTLTVSATSGAGAPVSSSAPLALHFSPEDVKGGLYYFSTSIRGLRRLPFGASTATDFIRNGNETGCVGCHAVSRDGKKVSAVFGGGDGYAGMVDGTDGKKYLIPPDRQRSRYRWNFESFNPDGSRMVSNWAGRLELRDGNGNLIREIPQNLYGARQAVMPEWSPDGQSIAFVAIPDEGFIGKDMPGGLQLPAGDWILGNGGSIAVMPYNGGNFGPARVVVPSAIRQEYNFYPSWSPDSKWIVFATAAFPGSSPTASLNGVNTSGKLMSYDQDGARLRLVSAAGGTPIELRAATHAMNRTATWPKFAPFIQGGGRIVFFTFSAKFPYGFVVEDRARPQLWMSAIDLSRASGELGGADPSYPPFWLPFQDPSQNNHEAIWTVDIGCVDKGGGDCPPEFTCEDGKCVPKPG